MVSAAEKPSGFPEILEMVPEIDSETIRKAQLGAVSRCVDVDDATLMLDMLGLLPQKQDEDGLTWHQRKAQNYSDDAKARRKHVARVSRIRRRIREGKHLTPEAIEFYNKYMAEEPK